MRNRFDNQLALLDQKLIHMGELCESAIDAATKAMEEGNIMQARSVIEMDEEIDQMEKEIERLCLKLLLQQQPVARDLRQISSALKMITDMERIGDQAADISEIVTYMSEENLSQELDRIDAMARAASQMVTQSVDAYVKKDLDLAKKVISDDDVVDQLFEEIKAELIQMIAGNPNCGEQALDFLMIAKYLERIGDHATNIAEWVEFSILGRHPEQDEIEGVEDRQEPSER